MRKRQDKDTRYFIDLDLAKGKVLNWSFGQRDKLAVNLSEPTHQRVFITKGQYNKLEKRIRAVGER
jgi:hypothetical protein